MCFGGVEVGFFTDQDDLIVNYAQIDVSRFTRSHMKFARNLNGEELHIHNPFGKKYPKYDLVGKQMQQAGLEYTTDYGKWRVEPPLIMRFGLVTFYFHDEEQTLMEVVLAEHV